MENPREDEVKEADVKSRLKEALCRLWQKDKYLLEKNVHEKSITSKLEDYLREHFSPEYDVDAEYNRDGNSIKRLSPQNEPVIVVPDVIVHRRGCNSRNLLVIEMKKKSPNQDGVDWDRRRIEAFCEQQHLRYSFGALVEVECGTKTPAIRAEWYSCQKWTDVCINLS